MTGVVLREVRLFGHLADGIGDTFRLAFDTPTRALRLLEANFPGFMTRFREGHYFVTVVRPSGERDLSLDALDAGFTGDLHIYPAAFGSASGRRKGVLGAILGAALIGAALFFSGGTLATVMPGVLGSMGVTFGSMAQLGVGLVLQGVATLLTPTPQTDYEDQKRSFVFNGPQNLADQGGVVPLVFGTMMVGTTTISASLDNEIIASESMSVQGARNSVHLMLAASTVIRLYYGDIAEIETGATLTHINGTAVSGNGTLNIPAMGLVVRYTTAGANNGIPGFPTGTTAGFTRPVIQITPAAGVDPAVLTDRHEIPFTFTHNAVPYEGKITVEMNKAAAAEAMFMGLNGTSTGGLFNDKDVTGN